MNDHQTDTHSPMICASCDYVRTPQDDAPQWQCPACERAYSKSSAHKRNSSFGLIRCPACGHQRSEQDDAPDWACPACDRAYKRSFIDTLPKSRRFQGSNLREGVGRILLALIPAILVMRALISGETWISVSGVRSVSYAESPVEFSINMFFLSVIMVGLLISGFGYLRKLDE